MVGADGLPRTEQQARANRAVAAPRSLRHARRRPPALLQDLSRLGRKRRGDLPAAIEDASSPLAAVLGVARFPVMPMHGLALARFRDGQTPSCT
jgi:hypothetical protein